MDDLYWISETQVRLIESKAEIEDIDGIKEILDRLVSSQELDPARALEIRQRDKN